LGRLRVSPLFRIFLFELLAFPAEFIGCRLAARLTVPVSRISAFAFCHLSLSIEILYSVLLSANQIALRIARSPLDQYFDWLCL
jgi:hypothetical protein